MNLEQTLLSYQAVIFSSPVIEKNNAISDIKHIAENCSLPFIHWDILTMGGIEFTAQEIIKSISEFFNKESAGVLIVENLFSMLNNLSQIQYVLVSSAIEKHFLEIREATDKYLIFLETQEFKVPLEFATTIPVYITPFPTFAKIKDILIESEFDIKDKRINLLSGLTKEEVKQAIKIAKNTKNIEESLEVYKQKQLEAIGLTFLGEPPVADFGGLDVLRGYLDNVQMEMSPEAREYGLPEPKGCMLVGPPGVGKTLTAKVIGKRLGLPLISVSIDAIKGRGIVYFSQILKRIEACAPCIAYFDEIDKMFPDISDSTDAGVLGVFLTWLQEKQGLAFVIATLNRLTNLPAEVTRLGRFDKIFYVGFPNASERLQIIKLYAKKYDVRYNNLDFAGILSNEEWESILDETENFSGAELAAVVQIAASRTFASKKKYIEYADLSNARKEIISLFERSPNSVMDIINKSKDFAINASSEDTSPFARRDESIYTPRAA